MEVIVQSFGEFKSSQMATAAHRGHTLRRYITAKPPSAYDGPSSKLWTVRSLYLLQGVGNRIIKRSDLSGYYTNKAFDAVAATGNLQCNLFVGYSGSCLSALRKADKTGAETVVYRGAPHGSFFQTEVDRLLKETGFEGIQRKTHRLTTREHREFEIANTVWVPSMFTAETLTARGISNEKIEVFPYGVDLSMFEPSEGRSANPLDILYVGGVTPEKGVHILLKALEEIGVEVNATLVGKESRRLSDMIDESPRADAIGWVDRAELAKFYRNASVVVFPSFADGYPSAVLEALACGCPVIVTQNVGTHELIEEYDAGRVIEPGSYSALVRAIESIRDDTRLDRMSANAVRAIQENEYDLSSRLPAMASFMNSLLN